MHQLLLPDQLAGRRPQRHDRVGVAIVAPALAAEEIRARRAGRDEHQIALRIDREDRPGIGGAGQRRLLGLPVSMGRIGRIARDRVPEPDAPAAAGIEGLHDAELQIDRPVVADRRPGDHQIARDRGRRRDRVLAGVGEADVHGEVDRAVVAEIRARPPGAAVERDQPAIQRTDEDPMRAGRIRCGAGIPPAAHAARGRLGVAAAAIDPGIMTPDLLARRRIERDHGVERGRQVEPALRQDRRRLERHLVLRREALARLAGAIGPGDLQLADIATVDLSKRSIAGAAGIAAIAAPAHRLASRQQPCAAHGGEDDVDVAARRPPGQAGRI